MKINVDLKDGLLPDKYGKFAPSEYIKNGKPLISFPVDFSDIPENAKSIAFTFTDPDSIPVCGFEWIHWTMANIPADMLSLPENFSHDASANFIQGKNSSASKLLDNVDPELQSGYNGPYPPDQTHDYVIHAYALDKNLDIKPGFCMNELLHAMDGHILDSATFVIPSRA
ncbi:YbhB/YbcL family Raf kinase inhibitor-like protein [Companilactobacillus mishanensis]|uniref:YbhB/YbcL family Raf kinase inhibitor-like protein n=1 Tax=Companilactobacillus mishanensis TaxID=2486008 RepID=A0ABW9P732_9LACO|nr:YbhB/YbcL family Raf kinase inhibitor-like protein [Companilactobacillus mishanensis]MQS44982.1 YbhB/YbcL family Raf kinase inhibitor-like protein [Companilactobacillus mishanensis]